MKNLPLILFLAVVLLSQSCAPSKEKPDPFVSKADSLFSTYPDFSGVVLIASKGKPLYHKAFGYINFETKVPVDTSSVFELASVSKQFTAMIIMMLQEDGKLSYDDPLEKYISGLPYPGITIRHLLNHTSGLPDYQSVMDEHWDKTKPAGNEEIIEYLIKYHPEKLFEPGTKYTYSNTGYVLLGTIAEKASGQDFINVCRERIFKPVGMASTDIRSLEEKAVIKNFALGHIFVTEKGRFISADSFPASNYIFWLGNRKGPGRISSVAGDLLKWDQALYNAKLIKPETLMQAFTPAKLKNDSLSNYGFGWGIRTHPAMGNVVQHTGSNPGYSNIIIRYIDKDKTVILLSNNAHPKFKEITDKMEALVSSN